MDRWSEGFSTQLEIFDWVSMSPYFRARRMSFADSEYTKQRKAREARGMYQRFIEYTTQLAEAQASSKQSMPRIPKTEEVVHAALHFFGKWEHYQSVLNASSKKDHVKQIFSGILVTEWTGLEGLFLKFLMDEVRERFSGEYHLKPSLHDESVSGTMADNAGGVTMKPWELGMKDLTLEEVRETVLKVEEDMRRAGTFERKMAERRAKKSKQPSEAVLSV